MPRHSCGRIFDWPTLAVNVLTGRILAGRNSRTASGGPSRARPARREFGCASNGLFPLPARLRRQLVQPMAAGGRQGRPVPLMVALRIYAAFSRCLSLAGRGCFELISPAEASLPIHSLTNWKCPITALLPPSTSTRFTSTSRGPLLRYRFDPRPARHRSAPACTATVPLKLCSLDAGFRDRPPGLSRLSPALRLCRMRTAAEPGTAGSRQLTPVAPVVLPELTDPRARRVSRSPRGSRRTARGRGSGGRR
jgi:hypothetical protein